MLKKALRAISRLYDDALADTGLTIAQFALLRNVARIAPAQLTRLAEIMVLDRTSLYRTLAPLEKAEWVTVEGVGHGRAKQAALTDGGRAKMLAATPAWDAAQALVAERFGIENWDRLQQGLAGIIALAQEEIR